MPYIVVNGRRLFYSDQQSGASGPALVLLHGAGGSHLVWPGPLRRLADTRVLALDLPGHGRSDPPGRRTISHYAAIVHDFIAALGLDVVLAGHSMGAAIALAAALASPPPIRGLILISGSAVMRVNDTLLDGWLASPERAAAILVEYGFSDAPDALREKTKQGLLDTGAMTTYGDFLACRQFDARRQLAGIDLPALVIGGSADRLVPPRVVDALASGLPHARRETIDGAGHFVMLERPEEVAALTAKFIVGLRSSSASRQRSVE